jgi:hypothetical protein
LSLRRAGVHAFAAARPGADQNEAPDEIAGLKRDFLRDKAADREAQHVDLFEPKRFDKSDGVGAHLLDRGRHLSRATGDAGIVEQNDLSLLRETIGDRRIPMVHGAGEVHVEDERHATRLAEPAVRKAGAVGLDELRRRDLVGINHYGRALMTQ